MHRTVIPVDERTQTRALLSLLLLLALPLFAAFAAGLVMKLTGRTHTHSFSGLLLWVVLIGACQFVVALVGCAGYATSASLRAAGPAQPPKLDPGLFVRRRGGSLMGALLAMFVLSVGMLLAVQAYYHTSAALTRTTNRSRALMVLESQAETLRAAGFAALPAPGRHALPAEALRGLPGATGSLTVRSGPAPGMQTVSLDLTWQEGDRPPGRTSLVFGMSARGMDP